MMTLPFQGVIDVDPYASRRVVATRRSARRYPFSRWMSAWYRRTMRPPRTPARAASIGDVARLAGVSPQTVSRVSRGSDKVRPQTRDKVLIAMEQLGYSPNQAARALRNGTLKIVRVLTQQIERTGEARTTSGVLEAAKRLGYAVIVSQVTHPETDEVHDALMQLAHQPIDGLVIVQSGTATFEHLALPPGDRRAHV